jgi:hypothetical protein
VSAFSRGFHDIQYTPESDVDSMSLSSCDSRSPSGTRDRARHSIGTAIFGRLSRSFTFDRASLRLGTSSSSASLGSKQSFPKKNAKKRVRFDLDRSTCRVVCRLENRSELWYHPRDLALGQAYHYQLAKHPCAQEYLRGSATLFDHVVRNAPLDYRLVSTSISCGLEDGYRGLERWTDAGKVRRLRAKAIIKKIVEAQVDYRGEDTMGEVDLPAYAVSLTKPCHAWAEMTGRLDAINAS